VVNRAGQFDIVATVIGALANLSTAQAGPTLNTISGQPYADFGHGTHVAGIVAGNGYDMNGVRSAIAPDANIISLKALDGQGHGTISMIIAAIDYAIANKDAFNIRVLNLSLPQRILALQRSDRMRRVRAPPTSWTGSE